MDEHIRSDRTYLHAHRLLMRLGLGLVHIFAWIFIFEYLLSFSGDLARAFAGVLVVYALSQAVMVILTPISAAHLRRGTKHSMVTGVILLACAFIVLGGTFEGYFSSPIGWGLVLFGILIGAYRALYWIPYRLQVARMRDWT